MNDAIKTILAISDSHDLGWNESTAASLLSDFVTSGTKLSLDDFIEAIASEEAGSCGEASEEKPEFTLQPGGANLPQAVADEAAGNLVIALPNQQYLVIPSTKNSPDGVEDVRILDAGGEEIVYWHSTEWGEDPVLVMGAIWGAIVGGANL